MILKTDNKGYGKGRLSGFKEKVYARKNPVLDKHGEEIRTETGDIKYRVGEELKIHFVTFDFVSFNRQGEKVLSEIKEIIDDNFFDRDGNPSIKFHLYKLAGLKVPNLTGDDDEDDKLLSSPPLSINSKNNDIDDDDFDNLKREVEESIDYTPDYKRELEPFINELKLKCKFKKKDGYTHIDVKTITNF